MFEINIRCIIKPVFNAFLFEHVCGTFRKVCSKNRVWMRMSRIWHICVTSILHMFYTNHQESIEEGQNGFVKMSNVSKMFFCGFFDVIKLRISSYVSFNNSNVSLERQAWNSFTRVNNLAKRQVWERFYLLMFKESPKALF